MFGPQSVCPCAIVHGHTLEGTGCDWGARPWLCSGGIRMIKPIGRLPPRASSQRLPSTVDEAVEHLLGLLYDWDDLPSSPEMDDVAMECLHVSLGPYIRQEFGLWDGNGALLGDCGVDDADDAYVAVLDALTRRLRQEAHSGGDNRGRVP